MNDKQYAEHVKKQQEEYAELLLLAANPERKKEYLSKLSPDEAKTFLKRIMALNRELEEAVNEVKATIKIHERKGK